jgi:hypothetical protein
MIRLLYLKYYFQLRKSAQGMASHVDEAVRSPGVTVMRVDLLPTTLEGKISRVVEECGEVLQAIGKIQRFGYRPIDPKTGIQYDNWAELTNELGQLRHAAKQVLEEQCPTQS